MAHIRADVVIPYRTKLPRDVAVNTFHFQTIGSWDEGDTTVTANALIDLYQQTIGGNTLSAFLSSCVDRTAGASIKFYNLDDPKPRHPFDTKPMGIAAAAWTGSLPLEVALCPLLPPVGVWAVSQSQCGGSSSQTRYRSSPW